MMKKASLLGIVLLFFLVGCSHAKDDGKSNRDNFLPEDFFNVEAEGEDEFYNYCLNSEYENPADVDLKELFYGGFGLELDQTDKDFLTQQEVDLSYDVVKLPANKMDQVMNHCFGISIKDSHWVGKDNFYYDVQTDVYYLVHNDSHLCKVQMLSQNVDGDGVIHLSYQKEDGKGEATLKKVGEEYHFISNQMK